MLLYWEYKLIWSVFCYQKCMYFKAKQNERIDESKYCPSLIATFSHLSGNFPIPYQKNFSYFEAIQVLKMDRTNLYF